MKFIIYRTYGEGKPCEEAKEEEVAIQYPWEGKPHKDKVWVVEINTLEELMKLLRVLKNKLTLLFLMESLLPTLIVRKFLIILKFTTIGKSDENQK